VLVYTLSEFVNFKRQRLVVSVCEFISSCVLELLKVVGGDALVVAMVTSRICAVCSIFNVSEVNWRKRSHVESFEDRSFAHIHSVLHGELEVLVRISRVLGVKELLQSNSFVVELDCNPLSSSPQLFTQPRISVVRVDNSISNVHASDGSDFVNKVLSSTIYVPTSPRVESVCTVSSRSFPNVNDRSCDIVYCQIALEGVVGAHQVEGCCSLRLISMDKILNGVLFSDATKSVIGDHPGVRVHNSRQVGPVDSRELPHVPQVRVSARGGATLLHLLVFFPVTHIIVDIDCSIPRIVFRSEVLELLGRVDSIPQGVVWRFRVSAEFWRSVDTRNGNSSPVVEGPGPRDEHFICVVRVKRLPPTELRFSPLRRYNFFNCTIYVFRLVFTCAV